MADRKGYSQPQVGALGEARTVKTLGGPIALLATDMAANNNTVRMFKAPKGFVCTGVYLALTDIDTGGSPAVLATLGDAGDDDRFVASTNIGQAGGSTTTLAATGLYYEFTDDTDVVLKFPTAAAAPAAGTATAYMTGFVK